MPKQVGVIDVTQVTKQRRVSKVLLQTSWDESVVPPTTRVTGQFEYEIMICDSNGKQISPSIFDGVVTMSDDQLRANPNFAAIYGAISQTAQDAKDAQDAAQP